MNEKNIPQILCEYLNSAGLTVFMPETWREDCGAVFLTGDTECVKNYVDGSSVVSLGFEVALRCTGHSAGDRLDVIRLLARLAQYVKSNPISRITSMIGVDAEVIPVGGAKRTEIFKDGGEEYRCAYELRYFREGGA